MDEEVALLEEQLVGANADIERLQSRVADLEAGATTRNAEAEELRRQLAEAQAELEVLRADNEALSREAAEQSAADAQRYRDLILAQEPDLPADLIAGDSVAEVDEAVARARQTVARVRQHIEQQAQSMRVPAGAPTRRGPDLSSLTPSEKIRLGLSGA